MGVTVKEKKPGEWWVFINHQGKRKAKKIGRDKRTAQEVAKKIEARLALGEFFLDDKKEVPTFKHYAKKWFTGYGESKLKSSTLTIYGFYLKKHVFPIFGDKKIDSITRPDIKDFIFQKTKELGTGSVKNLINLMSGIFSAALEDEIIKVNPASRMGKAMPKLDRKASINPFTREEGRTFLEAVKKHFPGYYELFLTALRTGLRLGELLALQWGDVDFNGRFIEVRRNFVMGRFTTPKNNKIRHVDISEQLMAALKELRARRKAETLRKGWGEVPALLFINNSGGVLCGGFLRKHIFKKALEKAGLREIRLHDLRHSFASMLLQQGASLVYVKDQMGHSSIQITVDTYGHLVPGANRNEVNKLDDATTRNPGATDHGRSLILKG